MRVKKEFRKGDVLVMIDCDSVVEVVRTTGKFYWILHRKNDNMLLWHHDSIERYYVKVGRVENGD